MARALLINPGFSLIGSEKRDTYIFPFGIGYIASFAEKHNHKIAILDVIANQLKFKDVIKQIEGMDFTTYNIIGITGIVGQYSYVKELTKKLKQKTSIPIILGGPLASYSYDLVLKFTDIDICVIGEGEMIFLDLLDGKTISNIDGIAYKSENEIIKTKDRIQVKNIDDLGYPAFHLFDMEFYINNSYFMDPIFHFYRDKKSLSIFTSRGCPYNCKFCSKSVKGIRMKSLDFLFKEIDYYIDKFKINGLHFIDELLLLNKKRFLEFCKRIKNYNINWDCQGRINFADKTILKAMKEANGVCIGFGIESGSQKILDAMDKRIKAKDLEKVLLFCTKIKLPVKIQLIFGYPGENWTTLNETLSLFNRLKLPGRRFTTIVPLPGSLLYEQAKKDGFIGDKETDIISEEKYLELLSENFGTITPSLFYNRTEFSDDEFFKMNHYIHSKIFKNFLKNIIIHPIYIIRNWYVYKFYIRNWIPRFKGGLFLAKIFDIIYSYRS